ncbi:Transcription factor [Komagataella phaffii CBS 7435]|uniref:Transcription factor required for gene regulation in repsonse to pheromones n=2 Tax=Komagataella phaffii TaxID=460519 RepID=C4R7Z5_KOMPG|nr:uncharacterized protein PAS_chr4_0468 [Komagataella phaffii GS115]AOA64695.1 GQ67_04827T0 [Komagataella phaffii]CAH2450891.1 Transcription factor [Komagataella phaffii CBS 7435]AOA70119.1 GQ68_04799T0 [Komagataella phaffii GS115]CAY71720.1 Transcription factor required for gene regulation in repsonse to pheromones [Komagataella phaffii GS115]CCA40676.1 Transcription factor [Komagataella phaffii CBS 7435]
MSKVEVAHPTEKRTTTNSNSNKVSILLRNKFKQKYLAMNSAFPNHYSHPSKKSKQKFIVNKSSKDYFKNDHTNQFIHTGKRPIENIRNIENPVSGYPKLQRLLSLKQDQINKYRSKPFGARVPTEKMVETIDRWVSKQKLTFDVIMIGGLSENQFIYPLLLNLQLDKLCSKPGFLFFWASTQQVQQLTRLLESSSWGGKFRRSEELVFLPVGRDSKYIPDKNDIPEESLLQQKQWHCWMCITGTVRRSTDSHLIHCNVNTDIIVENTLMTSSCNNIVPISMYELVENFSSSTRRLHILPASVGLEHSLKLRPGWVIVGPDVLVDNFDPSVYKQEISSVGSNVPSTDEIDLLRPKSPNRRLSYC